MDHMTKYKPSDRVMFGRVKGMDDANRTLERLRKKDR